MHSRVDFVLTPGDLLLGYRPAHILVKQYTSVTEAISVGSAITGEQSSNASRFRAPAIGINPVGLEDACALQGRIGEARPSCHGPRSTEARVRGEVSETWSVLTWISSLEDTM